MMKGFSLYNVRIFHPGVTNLQPPQSISPPPQINNSMKIGCVAVPLFDPSTSWFLLMLFLFLQKSFQVLLRKQEGDRSVWEYPFAVAGVNITYMLIQMLDLEAGLLLLLLLSCLKWRIGLLCVCGGQFSFCIVSCEFHRAPMMNILKI